MEQQLGVWFDGRLVGAISREGKSRLAFAYGKDWLKSGFPLSISLPLRSEPFDDESTRSFFDNLLPEEGIRANVSKQVHISEKNVFGLLETLGGECAGALSILPENEHPALRPEYNPVSNAKLGELIALLPKRPLLAGEDGVRLSLAGAQNKLPVAVFDGAFSIPLNGSPSTHILKPPIDDLPETVENETFCMSLARLANLTVPNVLITDTIPRGYLVARYDRMIEGGGIRRIHQEDFCQAMGLPVALKYQNEGGPGPEDCFALLDHCADPQADREQLFKLFVYNFLIGNTDAHAKNLSLLYPDPPRPVLAPFYDLLCTQVYVDYGLSTKNAMKIGGQYYPKFVMKRHWLRLAEQAGLTPVAGLNVVIQMANLLKMAAPIVGTEFAKRYGKSRIVPAIVEFVVGRCDQTLDRMATTD
ncbi:type II toxin-antitoxin system HipA family toxin [Pseudodesulfovibrio karagichevae]|uniref:Type II toxin-antitoxin system HipA family toxin n=1 Tax=Pseudodesulfovibrio karagichevae TaxID=3239305 RepID=A0ABV4K0X1_9BACT